VALDRVWVRPRHALLALKAHRTPLAALASDHLPVKAIVAIHDAETPKRGQSKLQEIEEKVF
jgi:hypothetical protein